MTEREQQWAAVLGGGLVTLVGVRRGGLLGLGLAAAGGAVAYLGTRPRSGLAPLSGRAADIYAAVGAGVNTSRFDHVAQAAKEERHPAGTLIDDPDDLIDDSSDDSFPASDPPSYTARG